MKRPALPADRCYLREFLQRSNMSKNTFFLRYRHNPAHAELLDVQEDRLHRLHLPIAAAEHLRQERIKKEHHGNRGRKPKRICPTCGGTAHPRHRVCYTCGAPFPFMQRRDL